MEHVAKAEAERAQQQGSKSAGLAKFNLKARLPTAAKCNEMATSHPEVTILFAVSEAEREGRHGTHTRATRA